MPDTEAVRRWLWPVVMAASRTDLQEPAMSEHVAQLAWQRGAEEDFTSGRYSRRHVLTFDGGAALAASSSPSVVRPPWSDPAAVDPEEMLVAALASCHMLWFLSLAADAGFTVDAYADEAVGVLAKTEQGKLAISTVTLRPQVRFVGERAPSPAEVAALHDRAHDECFIANSVRCAVHCQPRS
jgi:organic hydroperoxide reductase OsmC/OhrA